MCDCLPKMLCVYCIYIYIYHVNKFEARLLFLYLPLKNTALYCSILLYTALYCSIELRTQNSEVYST